MFTRIASRNKNLSIFATEAQGYKELLQAVYEDDDVRLQQLLDAGVPVDGCGEYSWTALIRASHQGRIKCLQILINNGADVNAKTILLETGLHWAVGKGHIDCARMLIANGARIDEIDTWGRTPLIKAGVMGDNKRVGSMRLLLRNNADVLAMDDKGMTALDYAKHGDNGEMVKMLEEYNAGLITNKTRLMKCS